MKKIVIALLFVSLSLLIVIGGANAQSTDELQLGMSRDWGYGGFGNDIQGTFTMKIKDPPTGVVKVAFFIDDTQIGEDNQPPFGFQFNTDSYPLGLHNLHAIGYTSDGKQFGSNSIQAEFVPEKDIISIIGPVFGMIILVVVVSAALPFLLNRGKLSTLAPGTQRKYGIGGGAICPNCNRPFPLRLWWINLGTSKIDRCPYCGRFGFFHPRSKAELRRAEAAELEQAQADVQLAGESEEEKLKKEIDSSKFQDI